VIESDHYALGVTIPGGEPEGHAAEAFASLEIKNFGNPGDNCQGISDSKDAGRGAKEDQSHSIDDDLGE
jgi:hypothetical protein